MASKVTIKGIREGLLITLGEGSWPDVQQTLLDHIDEQGEFYRGARLALDVGNHILKATDLAQLRNLISERQLSLWAVLSNSPTTEQTAQTLGLATRLSKPRPELTAAKLETTVTDGEAAMLVRRTLRSGYRLQYEGHVIVIGDVNPGAEIIARGDVIVWGRLRGMVHAGSQGNTQALVCALELSPTQLRIAGQIAANPPLLRRKGQPEMAQIVNGHVITEPWNPKKK